MITTSDKYKTDLYNAKDYYLHGSITLSNDKVIELTSADIIQGSFKFQESCTTGSAFGVGGMVASQVDMGLFLDLDNPFLLTSAQITLSCTYVFDDNSEQEIPIGTFYIDSGTVKRSRHTISFTAYDGMVLFDKIIPKSTMKIQKAPYEYIQLACAACNVSLATSVATLKAMPNGTSLFNLHSREEDGATQFNWRDLLTFAAELLGSFGRINRATGELEIIPFAQTVDFTINEDNAIDRTVADTSLKVTGAKYDEQLSGNDGFVLDLSSNLLLKDVSAATRLKALKALVAGMSGVEFYTANITWFGDLSVQAGDCFEYKQENLFGGTRKIIVMENIWKLGGTCQISSFGDTTANQYNPISKIALAQAEALEYVKTNYLLASSAEIAYAKITELEAANAEITRIESEFLAANEIMADDIAANSAAIATLQTESLTANSAVIQQIRAEMLTANSAIIADLQSSAALFDTYSSVFGFTQNSQSINLTAENVTIDEAVVKNMIAKKITVADLLTASAQAERIDIIKDGSSSISFLGSTQQFYDSNGKVRVQIGQAADGDFKFLVCAADGATAILNSSGITSAAVPDGLIVDSMVSDSAHIQGGKIDMESLVEEINDSEYKLKTSALIYDESGQSLSLEFQQIINKSNQAEEKADAAESKVDALTERADSGEFKGEKGADAILLMIESANGNIFKNSGVATILTVTIIAGDKTAYSSKDMQSIFGKTASLTWQQKKFGEKEYTVIPSDDSRIADGGFIFTLSPQDVLTQTVFNCELNY